MGFGLSALGARVKNPASVRPGNMGEECGGVKHTTRQARVWLLLLSWIVNDISAYYTSQTQRWEVAYARASA